MDESVDFGDVPPKVRAFLEYCVVMYPMLSTGDGAGPPTVNRITPYSVRVHDSEEVQKVRDKPRMLTGVIRRGSGHPLWHACALYVLDISESCTTVRSPWTVLGCTDKEGDTWVLDPLKLKEYVMDMVTLWK